MVSPDRPFPIKPPEEPRTGSSEGPKQRPTGAPKKFEALSEREPVKERDAKKDKKSMFDPPDKKGGEDEEMSIPEKELTGGDEEMSIPEKELMGDEEMSIPEKELMKKGKGTVKRTTADIAEGAAQPQSGMIQDQRLVDERDARKGPALEAVEERKGSKRPGSQERTDFTSVGQETLEKGSSYANVESDVGGEVRGGGGARSLPVRELVDQIVDKVYTLSAKGETSTVITLKDPPVLAGASITIKSYDSAKGEFNISFSNLSPDAKALIDLQQSRYSLQQALQERGYTVHIVVTTTQDLQNVPKAEPSKEGEQGRGDRDQGQQGQGREGQQQRDREPNK